MEKENIPNAVSTGENVENIVLNAKAEAVAETDKNKENDNKEVNETSTASDEYKTVDDYANKYDEMVKENEELKTKLSDNDKKVSDLEVTIKTLQEGMAKLKKANEFASSRSSIQQNQRADNEVRAEDIIALRSKI